MLMRRRRVHAAALMGSSGQGAPRCCHQSAVLNAISTPDKTNNVFLWADSHMMPGMAEVRPAITAPAPKEISSAGSAQHSSVDALPNSAKVGATVSRQSPLTSRYPALAHRGALQPRDIPPAQPIPRSSRHSVLPRG